jgi:hypothetical protein
LVQQVQEAQNDEKEYKVSQPQHGEVQGFYLYQSAVRPSFI